MQRSAEFYQKMFGFKVIREDRPLHSSARHDEDAGVFEHAMSRGSLIGVPASPRKAAARRRSAARRSLAGLHVKDPDGINVQIFDQR
jgi:hypothetical protein